MTVIQAHTEGSQGIFEYSSALLFTLFPAACFRHEQEHFDKHLILILTLHTLYTTFCVTQANPTTDALPLDNDKQKISETNFKIRFKAVLYMLCVMHSHCWGYHYSTVKYLPSAA